VKEIQKTIQLEGGYVNDPDDPGGETKFGISKRAFPHVDIASLTKEQAAELYKDKYWDVLHLDDFKFLPFRFKVLDIAVNMGVATATTFIGLLDERDNLRAVWQLIEMQAKRYASIVIAKPHQIKYLRGWMNRAFETGEDLI
jgi:hypothetical protein